jgi:hypothetical protein
LTTQLKYDIIQVPKEKEKTKMKEIKLIGNWTIGWYPMFNEWFIGCRGEDSDTDFEICLGKLNICHWKVGA